MNVVIVIISHRGQAEATNALLSELGWWAGNLTVPFSQTEDGEPTHLGLCATVQMAQAEKIVETFQGTLPEPEMGAYLALSGDISPRQHFETVLNEQGLQQMRQVEP